MSSSTMEYDTNIFNALIHGASEEGANPKVRRLKK